MTSIQKYFIPLLALVFLTNPLVTKADTLAVQQEKMSIRSQLSDIQAELTSPMPGTESFMLSPGQSISQASTTPASGILTISLPSFVHTNPDPTIPPIIPQTVTHFAKITLEFDPCTAVTPGICSAQASSSYPVMTSLLSPGQYTGYLHYLITLNSLNASTANFTITDTTVFTSIQNKLNAITAQIMALHN